MKKFLLFLPLLVACTQAPTDNIEQQIEKTLQQLTLQEKIALCHAQSKFSTPGVPRLGIPELWWSDGPHGVRGEINWDDWGYAGNTNDSVTAFPALTALSATFNPELSRLYGRAVGEEARYRKKDVLLGPGVNIYRSPLCGRNFEYMGEDPYLSSVMCVPYIQGLQSNGVACSVKHFALNNQEQYRSQINVRVSERALREIYLPAFKAAVTEGHAWTVMGAYNKYNDQHCCHNEILLNDILKGEWQYDGVVVTDWGGAHSTREAALYGCDVEMGTWTNGLTESTAFAYDNYFLAKPFEDMIKSGEVDEKVLDDKVRRILRLMYRTNMNPNRDYGCMNNDQHSQVAHNVGAEAVVLLKNDNNLLPLDPNTEMTIAVIGENATRPMAPAGGSSELKAKYEISPLEGIRRNFPKATILTTLGYAGGPSAYGRVIPSPLNADSLMNEAVKVAEQADVVIFVGGLNKSHQQDCEDGDRVSLELPFGQNELIERLAQIQPNIAVVLISGNAVSMPWIDSVPTVLEAWYLGSEAGRVIGQTIAGVINPSGKLPFTFPVQLSDSPAHCEDASRSRGERLDSMLFPGDGENVEYREGIFVGYRWYEHKDIKPLFAFGHGLSYTTFTIDNVQCNVGQAINVSCSVTNTGERAGAEVVQVYVGKNDSQVERAPKELKAFQKVFVQADASERVNLQIPVEDLSYWDETTHQWTLEKGEYTIYVGTASDNILYTEVVEIK